MQSSPIPIEVILLPGEFFGLLCKNDQLCRKSGFGENTEMARMPEFYVAGTKH